MIKIDRRCPSLDLYSYYFHKFSEINYTDAKGLLFFISNTVACHAFQEKHFAADHLVATFSDRYGQVWFRFRHSLFVPRS